MTAADLQPLLPLLLLAGTAVAVLMAIAARRSHGLAFALSLAGLGVAIAFAAAGWHSAPRRVGELLVIDRFALFYLILIASGAAVTALLSYGYLPGDVRRKEEFYVLLLLSATGAAVLAGSTHFASFFLGLELLTVPLYALIAYRRRLSECIEAGVKYLVLAGVASAVLLFGMALVYADLGTMQLGEVVARSRGPARGAAAAAGAAMILAAIGFKLALVPFHLWAADVYEGAPAPVSAFLATVSKGAVFALLLRHFARPELQGWGLMGTALAVIAAASMLAGNLLALRQDNLKRLLAYSSIAHMGYLLTAFLAGGRAGANGPDGRGAVTFYLVAYVVTTLGAFGVLAALSGGGRDAGRLEDLRGLLWRRPALGGVLAAMLLSLAGLPLTAGFMGKLYLLAAGVGAGLWALAAILAASSAIGLYYYLRVIVVLCGTGEPGAGPQAAVAADGEGLAAKAPAPAPAGRAACPATAGLALAILAAMLVWLGVHPGPMIQVIQGLFSGPGW